MNTSSKTVAATASARKRRDKEQHRQAVLDAAERVMVREGYKDATIGQIAAEAGFSVGTLYNMFVNKEDLHDQILTSIARELVSALDAEVHNRPSPVEALAALIDLRMRVFERHRGFYRILFEHATGSRTLAGNSPGRELVQLRERYRRSVREILSAGVRRGVFDDIDATYQTLCFEGMFHALVAYWSARRKGAIPRRQVDKMKQVILSRFCRRTAA